MIGAYATIEEIAAALAARAASSVEVMQMLLRRIAALDGELHAFAEVSAERALAQARAADERRAAGEGGPLLGVPLAVKDIFDVAGQWTRAGSLALDDRLAETSATAVARLESAGMVVLGRTEMVEFAYGGWGTNPVRGAPRNPWDRTVHRVAAGSSSGSAVAVAAGLVPAALGTDTGGSVRTPAAWCGIVGMKTSVGLIGRGGVVPLAPTHDTVGPMTRSVRDAALLLAAMSGPDARDDATIGAPLVDPLAGIEDGVRSLRFAVLPDADLAVVEAPVRSLYESTLTSYRRLGAEVAEMRLPQPVSDYLGPAGDIMSVEAYAHLGRYVERYPHRVDPVIAARIMRGKTISGPAYYTILRERREGQTAFMDALSGFDAMILPGSHMSPIALSDVDEDAPPNRFGRVVNYLDLASLAVPAGVTGAGLPGGVQIVVRKFGDALALRIGRALERDRGSSFARPPGFGEDLLLSEA